DAANGMALAPPPPGSAVTAMGWEVAPQALTQQLIELRDRYGNPPVVVTENGAAFSDRERTTAHGRIDDHDRAAYVTAYLREVSSAIEAGCDVRGYFVWT